MFFLFRNPIQTECLKSFTLTYIERLKNCALKNQIVEPNVLIYLLAKKLCHLLKNTTELTHKLKKWAIQ